MHAQALQVLTEMTRALLAAPGPQEALKRVTDAALAVLGGDHASVRLCSSDGLLEVGARSGVGTDLPAPAFRRGQGLLGWVAETGCVARVPDCLREPRFQDRHERGFAVGSVLSVPVFSGGQTVGVLSVSSPQQAAFSDTHEALAQLLASAAALALHTAELRRLSLTDSQTKAYNRRYLLPRLTEEIERASRRGDALSILLIDLDHFKDVNDRHGHAVGDAVLAAFADAVRGCVRAVDVLVRRGGEEFVLIMPATDQEHAVAVAERIRGRLAESPLFVHAINPVWQTASIGVSTWDREEGPEQLEERADRAMYEAKRLGRDRVVVAATSTPPSHDGTQAAASPA